MWPLDSADFSPQVSSRQSLMEKAELFLTSLCDHGHWHSSQSLLQNNAKGHVRLTAECPQNKQVTVKKTWPTKDFPCVSVTSVSFFLIFSF